MLYVRGELRWQTELELPVRRSVNNRAVSGFIIISVSLKVEMEAEEFSDYSVPGL